MNFYKKIFALIVSGVICNAVNAQSPYRLVTPKQLFPSKFLNVYAPDTEGWLVTAAANNGISFGKKGSERDETYGAQVIIFELSSTIQNEELVNFVKQRVAKMNPYPRFQETDANYQYIESRGYPCVKVDIVRRL